MESGDIRLDPEVVENEAVSHIPLSDLYELPVFSADAMQKAEEHHMKEKQMLEQIRREVFEADEQTSEEWFERIRGQIFEIAPVFPLEDRSIKTENAQDIWGTLVMAAVVFLLLAPGIWKAFGRRKDISEKDVPERNGKNRENDNLI